jgi:hypothetical protein
LIDEMTAASGEMKGYLEVVTTGKRMHGPGRDVIASGDGRARRLDGLQGPVRDSNATAFDGVSAERRGILRSAPGRVRRTKLWARVHD